LFPTITKENIDNFKQAIETMYKVKTFIKWNNRYEKTKGRSQEVQMR
jgi:hypothetical protein